MSQLFLVNPRKRRRKASGARRKASPAQLAARKKFAAMARARSGSAVRRRRRHAPAVMANPAPRRRRRSSGMTARVRRRIRRNPINRATMRASFKSATDQLLNAATGAAGAIGVDVVMGQAAKVLPDNMISRYTPEGGINWAYYAAKFGIAFGLGVVGNKYAPANMRHHIANAAQGSLTVQAYEIMRASLPPTFLTLGYYNPAKVGVNGARTMRAYSRRQLPASAGGTAMGRYSNTPAVVGATPGMIG